MIGIAIITHGHFGEELLRTAQEIVGRQDEVLAFSVTSETGMDNVCQFIEESMNRLHSSDGVLFLVDMLGGTPCNAAVLKTRESSAEVVTGINLYMLISAFTHRSHLDLRALALKVAEDGKRAISLPKDLLVKKGGDLMPVVLVRIDDRLVHGQVVEGWLKAIRATAIVVASDYVAADETQKALYLLAVPQGTKLQCLSISEAAEAWSGAAWNKERVLVLVSTPQDALALREKGADIPSVNVGGMHYRDGRVQILKAVSVDDKDVAALKSLLKQGVFLEARPLPLDEPVELKAYLDRWQQDRDALREQPR